MPECRFVCVLRSSSLSRDCLITIAVRIDREEAVKFVEEAMGQETWGVQVDLR